MGPACSLQNPPERGPRITSMHDSFTALPFALSLHLANPTRHTNHLWILALPPGLLPRTNKAYSEPSRSLHQEVLCTSDLWNSLKRPACGVSLGHTYPPSLSPLHSSSTSCSFFLRPLSLIWDPCWWRYPLHVGRGDEALPLKLGFFFQRQPPHSQYPPRLPKRRSTRLWCLRWCRLHRAPYICVAFSHKHRILLLHPSHCSIVGYDVLIATLSMSDSAFGTPIAASPLATVERSECSVQYLDQPFGKNLLPAPSSWRRLAPRSSGASSREALRQSGLE